MRILAQTPGCRKGVMLSELEAAPSVPRGKPQQFQQKKEFDKMLRELNQQERKNSKETT